MSLPLIIYLFIVVPCFLVACCEALYRGVTVWQLLAAAFRDLARGMGAVFGAVGLAPKQPPATARDDRPVRDRIKIGGLTQTAPVDWDPEGWHVIDVDNSRPGCRHLIWERDLAIDADAVRP